MMPDSFIFSDTRPHKKMAELDRLRKQCQECLGKVRDPICICCPICNARGSSCEQDLRRCSRDEQLFLPLGRDLSMPWMVLQAFFVCSL
jgi:hypothetical protein